MMTTRWLSDEFIPAGQAAVELVALAAAAVAQAANEMRLPADEARTADDLRKPDVQWLVRRDAGQVIAFIAFFVSGDNYLGSRARVFVLQEVWVDSLYRKQGHAASLAEAVRRRAEEDRQSPRVGGYSPVSTARVVVLPAPLCPRRHEICPA